MKMTEQSDEQLEVEVEKWRADCIEAKCKLDPDTAEVGQLTVKEWRARCKAAEEIKVKGWEAICQKAARKINPETAEVYWRYGQDFDPYELGLEIPEEYDQVGRVYFARSPGSRIWVGFFDLPEATSNALWEKHKASLAFPAGLPLESLRAMAEAKTGEN